MFSNKSGLFFLVISKDFANINSLSLSLSNTAIKFAKGSRLTVFNPIKGAKGDKGETGDVGPANTLTIGSVTKGDEASANITGESPNQVLNLVLPKGDQGEQGVQGVQGNVGPANTLTIGTVTSGDVASATLSGESPNQVLNLVLPKGDQGDPGVAGGTMTVDDIEDLIESKMGIMYPVGSIYMSVNNINPSTLFGGIWEQIKDRFLLAAGDSYVAGSTGGHAELQEHSHVIPSLSGTAQSSGNHNHVTSRRTSTYGSGMQANWRCITAPSSANGDYNQVSNTENSGAHTHNITTNASNTGTTGNGDGGNMPPYLTVYVWKRVS